MLAQGMFAQRIRPERATDEIALNRRLALMVSQRDSRLIAHPRIPNGVATTDLDSAALSGRISLAA